MTLRTNSEAPRIIPENTQGKSNRHQWKAEADEEGELYGENGERMPYYPARPRQQHSYELSWDQNAWRFSSAGAGDRDASMTSPNVTRAQSQNPSPRLGPRTMPLVKIVGAAAIALLAAGNTLANAAENPARLAQEQHACAVVLGLDPLWRRSLERSLSRWDDARLISTDRSVCTRGGLQPGTRAFAVCVVKAEQSQ